jgi:AcrR family transcriptional regulator
MPNTRLKKASDPSVLTRPGIYACGSDTVNSILKAALHVLIEEGAAAFTLRRIASECGLKLGNVSRHFSRKEMLLQVLLEELLKPSEGLVEQNIRKTGMSAEAALTRIIEGSLDEIKTKRMTHLSIELWAMANHNELVDARVKAWYHYFHKLVAEFVKQLNPKLNADEAYTVAIFICASIEGSTMLAGFGKPWSSLMPQMQGLAVKSLVNLVKTITPAELQALAQEDVTPKNAHAL